VIREGFCHTKVGLALTKGALLAALDFLRNGNGAIVRGGAWEWWCCPTFQEISPPWSILQPVVPKKRRSRVSSGEERALWGG